MNSGVCRNTPIFRILGWLDVERNQIRHESGTRTLTGRSQSDHDPTISGDGTDRNDPHSVHAIDGVRPGSHACSKKPREAVTNDESTIVSRRGSKRAWACARLGTHGDQQAGRAAARTALQPRSGFSIRKEKPRIPGEADIEAQGEWFPSPSGNRPRRLPWSGPGSIRGGEPDRRSGMVHVDRPALPRRQDSVEVCEPAVWTEHSCQPYSFHVER